MRRTWRRVRVSLVRESADQPYAMRDSRDVVGLLRAIIGDDPREHFCAVYVDGRHRPIGVHVVAVGNSESCGVHPREVFGPALSLAAAAVIVAHNHPSGDPTPSAEDRAVTARLRDAGDLLGVALLDHVVIGDQRYYTFASESFGTYTGKV
jgi:DNA repair protein RadC